MAVKRSKFESETFKQLIGGSTASSACSMQGDKFERKTFKLLIGGILQAMLAVCRGIKMIVNYKMILQYDGTRYNGWQKQGNTKNTIQGKIEEILFKYFGQEIELHGSGRTDAGVHAVGQVANFKVEYQKASIDKIYGAENNIGADKEAGRLKDNAVEKIKDELNSFLPEDIRILTLEQADNRFHARLNAVEKEYRYYISLDRKRDVFARKYMAQLEYPEKLDIERMRSASERFIGEHDFQGFSDNKSKKSTIRRIDSIEFRLCGKNIDNADYMEEAHNGSISAVQDGCLEIIFRGNGFLYHMVRLIVGTLLAIGMGEASADVADEIFESCDRKRVPYMAPAEGLFLYRVEY